MHKLSYTQSRAYLEKYIIKGQQMGQARAILHSQDTTQTHGLLSCRLFGSRIASAPAVPWVVYFVVAWCSSRTYRPPYLNFKKKKKMMGASLFALIIIKPWLYELTTIFLMVTLSIQ